MKRLALLLLTAFVPAGCGGMQSPLDAEGPSAAALKDLIVTISLVCTAVWLAVMIVMAAALLRRRGEEPTPDRTLAISVKLAVAATVAIISALTLLSFYATRALGPGEDVDLTIRVRAQQWWWQFTYEGDMTGSSFQTANEIHIPVGKVVRVRLESPDVIHSFWVPSLAGKLDVIPGRENILTFRADRPGVYRGQCAEFCGLQHSHMAFLVLAEDAESFARWAAVQRADAAEPESGEALAGKGVFLARQCAACHTIRGTPAAGVTGPDLTHVAGRRTIGAGLLEMTRGSLAAWIADPQTLKPGNAMPLVPLSPEELQQVSAYMEGLK